MFAALTSNSASLGPYPSQGVSFPPDEQSQLPAKPSPRRRIKPQMSCTRCRQKKLKCDRVKPCLNCTKRGEPESCDYVKQDSTRVHHAGPHKAVDVQDRVRQLEGMVMSLLNSQNSASGVVEPPTATPSSGAIQDSGFAQSSTSSPYTQTEDDIRTGSSGNYIKSKDSLNFVGSEHWEAILEDIADLKIDLEASETSGITDFKPQMLFGMNRASRSDIVSSIPPRSVCDVLISRWFKNMDMAPMVVHVPTFMKEYDTMFEEPNETPLMWIGLLFSILGLGSYFYAVSGEQLGTMPQSYTSMWEMSSHFRDRTMQCLVGVNYLQPKRYTVETLCFYYALEKFQAVNSEFGAYVIFGVIVRVAMRLGYHRDASHHPKISPFDGEMRRRVWSLIFQLDLVASAQVGLPRMIRQEETDTTEPKNLLDTDFEEGMTELPQPRPSTDVTPVGYAIFMVRLLRQLGLIIDQINSVKPPPYDEVMRLDSRLMETHATLPPYLRMRSLGLSITDAADLILRRCALEVSFQKSRCVLHRRYTIPGKYNTQFQYSRTASVDAAMKLLDVQLMFHEGTQPGGQLFGERWRTFALLNQDYILAAMILCLDISWDAKMDQRQSFGSDDEVEAMWPINKRLQAVKDSYDIWCKSSATSALAAKAAEALRAMLKDLESARSAESELRMSDSNAATSIDGTLNTQIPIFSDQINIGVLGPFASNNTFFTGSTALDFNTKTDAEINFDWELWDSQFLMAPVVMEDFDI